MEAPNTGQSAALTRRALRFVAPFKSAIAGIVAVALVLAVTNALDPLVMKYLFDALGGSAGRDELWPAIAARFDLPDVLPPCVKDADNIALEGNNARIVGQQSEAAPRQRDRCRRLSPA